ncbi:hypothetical protein DRN97_08910 [Methanosarcinales archaeon]|nr:MAG: hypothetical protein DRN97_08910 [Methanosarcinales archaeon]
MENYSLAMDNQSGSQFSVLIVTGPFNDIAGEQNLSYLIETFRPLSSKIIAIAGRIPKGSNKKVKIIRLKSYKGGKSSLMFQILNHLLVETQICINMLRMSKDFDIVAFQIGARTYLLSTLLSKLLKKKVIAFSFTSSYRLAQIGKGQKLSTARRVALSLASILERGVFLLADQIAVESESVIGFSGLKCYKNKISVYGAQYIDMELFGVRKELNERKNLIGYIGRFSREKGVINFVRAIPMIIKEKQDTEFFMGGGGELLDKILKEIKLKGLQDKVKLIDAIPHEKVPGYLNEMKLLILPSYTEGIPGIVQEAMACGTPVLATPVGGIPDLIKDGETGFIMENNSPECIAKNVIRALEHPNLEQIVKNARKLIEDEYSYEVMVRKCKIALDKLMERKS